MKTQDVEFENDMCFAVIQCQINPVADFDFACVHIEKVITADLLETCANGDGDIQEIITDNCGDLVFNAIVTDFQRKRSPLPSENDEEYGFEWKDITPCDDDPFA